MPEEDGIKTTLELKRTQPDMKIAMPDSGQSDSSLLIPPP